MTAIVTDGLGVAKAVPAECRTRIDDLLRRTGVRPGLAVLNVGDDPTSAVYIRTKIKACGEVGIKSAPFHFDRDCDQRRGIDIIAQLNDDPTIHGILVQLPLPPQFQVP
ncbi:MAG: tetrahydrofolate dehydrogenase/cyclohydrolase catalytic domain-containing protein [Xanthobacteraceae bacterium]